MDEGVAAVSIVHGHMHVLVVWCISVMDGVMHHDDVCCVKKEKRIATTLVLVAVIVRVVDPSRVVFVVHRHHSTYHQDINQPAVPVSPYQQAHR